jgi:hypothetical protein
MADPVTLENLERQEREASKHVVFPFAMLRLREQGHPGHQSAFLRYTRAESVKDLEVTTCQNAQMKERLIPMLDRSPPLQRKAGQMRACARGCTKDLESENERARKRACVLKDLAGSSARHSGVVVID